ncbi:MAG: M48 family metallopeptidase [Pseudomonadota bacterium]|nr:M48 family metallopeptidase [Pseudomonadota bacterium]
MNGLTWLFIAAVAAETAVRLWLASRQAAAVTAHRDRVPEAFRGQIQPEDQRKAADYTVARVRLGRWAALLDVLVKLGFTVGGGLAAVAALTESSTWPEPWHGTLVVLLVFVLLQLLGLPIALWRTFRIEARFGFNRISPALFAVDLGKRLALGLVLGAPMTLAAVWLMERAGVRWWVWAWIGWLAASLVLTWAAPRFIAPLFNRFTAINDAALRQRVEALLERCGFAASGGVFVMDGSKRSAHGNAYFTGIGRNKRIVFFDTLLSRIELDEIEAVLAHELGHFRLHHVRHRWVTSMVAALGGLAMLGLLAREPAFYRAFGVPESASMALLLFAMTIPTFTFFLTPIESWWSRRQELAADAFAAKYAHAADLVSALVKLYRDNATTLTPDRLHSAFYDSHPPALERITRLQALATR